MSETPDQYYLTLESAVSKAMEGAPPDAVSTHVLTHAVAAQVLRDLIEALDERFIVIGVDEEDGNVRTAIDVIEKLAAERGIDLGDES